MTLSHGPIPSLKWGDMTMGFRLPAPDVVAVEPPETGERIGRHILIGVADMRRSIRIGDRSGDVVFLGAHRRLAVKSEARVHSIAAAARPGGMVTFVRRGRAT